MQQLQSTVVKTIVVYLSTKQTNIQTNKQTNKQSAVILQGSRNRATLIKQQHRRPIESTGYLITSTNGKCSFSLFEDTLVMVSCHNPFVSYASTNGLLEQCFDAIGSCLPIHWFRHCLDHKANKIWRAKKNQCASRPKKTGTVTCLEYRVLTVINLGSMCK